MANRHCRVNFCLLLLPRRWRASVTAPGSCPVIYYPTSFMYVFPEPTMILLIMTANTNDVDSSAFAHMTVAVMKDAHTASSIVTVLTIMSIVFSGVLQTANALPGFWKFMYRVSPFTYWIGGIVATELHGRPIYCSPTETSIFDPPPGSNCGEYLAALMDGSPGQLQNPSARSQCQYCPVTNADQLLQGSRIYWSKRWRNFGIFWAYIAFDIFLTILLYYVVRIKKWNMQLLVLRRPKHKQTVNGS